MIDYLFYIFAFFSLLSSFVVVSVRNGVYSALALIFLFFNVAFIFVLLKAEFLAMLLVIVYVGAVAVLFLFVVMMINVDKLKLEIRSKKLWLFSLLMIVVLFCEILGVIQSGDLTMEHVNKKVSNIDEIGSLLYIDYAIIFQLSGIVLLLAIVASISLTLRKVATDITPKTQDIVLQNVRKVEDCIEVVRVESGKGVS